MKRKIVNGRWVIDTPDVIADWDGGSGDYSVRRGWEFARFESLEQNLCYGDVLFEIGAEHGWMSALIGREMCGTENMVLFEPSPEFWINIRKIWDYNGLNAPKACYQGFVAETTTGGYVDGWPECAIPDHAEIPSMAYRQYGLDFGYTIPSTTIDDFIVHTGIAPDAINMDVEGSEIFIVRGAMGTLLQRRPLVWISIHPELLVRDHGSSKQEVLDVMEQANYEGHFLGEDHEEHWFFTPR